MAGSLCSGPQAFSQSAEPTDAATIANAIEKLGSNRFRVRDSAFQLLIDSGVSAIGALEKAANSDSLEVGTRCLDALVRIAADKECFPTVVAALDRLALDPTNSLAELAKARSADLKMTDEDRAVAALTRAGVRIFRGSSGSIFSVSITDDRQAVWLRHLQGLRSVRARGADFTDEGIKHVARAPQLSSLTITGCAVTDTGLSALRDQKSLRRVSLSGDSFSAAGIRELKHLASLSSLAIFSPVDEQYLKALTEVPQLDSLYLSKLQLSPQVAEDLNRLQHLRRVNVTVTGIDDERLQWLGDIQVPLHLGIERSEKISEDGWNHLADSRLLGLSIERCPISDADLAHIGKLELLESLTIRYAKITDSGLDQLQNLKALASLDLGEVEVTEQGIAKLRAVLPHLSRATVRNRGAAPLAVPVRTRISFTDGPGGEKNAHVRVKLTPADIEQLKKEEKLATVFLTGGKATDEDLTLLRDAPMKGLVIDSRHVSSAGFKALEGHPTLESLSLWSITSASSINDESLVLMGNIRSLNRLIVKKAPISDDGLASLIDRLSEVGKIKSLSLDRCPHISNHGLRVIGKLKTLERLYLSQNPGLTSGLLQEVAKLTNLRRLSMNELALDESDLAHLSSLVNLESLSLSRAESDGSLTNQGMQHLSPLKSLSSLTINNANIDDDGVTTVAKLSKLRTLSLYGTQISDAGLANLANQLTDLESLVLSATQVTDSGMSHVGKLTKLKTLRLGQTAVGDDGLKQLDGLTDLESIYVDQANVTSEGHRQFHRAHPETKIQLK
jgi:Leucine-rich repeat (LRR) protein